MGWRDFGIWIGRFKIGIGHGLKGKKVMEVMLSQDREKMGQEELKEEKQGEKKKK